MYELEKAASSECDVGLGNLDLDVVNSYIKEISLSKQNRFQGIYGVKEHPISTC
jgi:hypothetical protein